MCIGSWVTRLRAKLADTHEENQEALEDSCYFSVISDWSVMF